MRRDLIGTHRLLRLRGAFVPLLIGSLGMLVRAAPLAQHTVVSSLLKSLLLLTGAFTMYRDFVLDGSGARARAYRALANGEPR